MNPLLQFWNERYGIDRALETESNVARLLNRYVVSALMNTFPRAATTVFLLSEGELARRLFVEKEKGSFRVLRAMYDHNDVPNRGDFINRLLMQSPAIKAARNRRIIAQRMLEQCLKAQPSGLATLVLAIGGGDGNLEAEVIARMKERDVYYCGVDIDDKAVGENQRVLREHGLDGRGFVFVDDIAGQSDLQVVLDAARKRFRIPFEGAGVTVCHGIAEYLDIGSDTNEVLAKLLTAIHDCTRAEGSLVISQTDFHDRVRYLERGLSWYMRLRSSDELAREVERAGWQLSVCEQEPLRLITMCVAVKSDAQHQRIDHPSQFRRPCATRPVPAAARWRPWARRR
ncbi:MAG: hypothetical protein ACYC35_05640 [Pirellulales bacterium]